MAPENDAIGIFDSGVGGLTVAAQVAARLPRESLVYLGDTARVPYGTKSPDTVIRYANACARVLLERGIKLLVVACNTASAFALEALRATLDVPVIGVIEPGARAAVKATRTGSIGVIGTAGTIASGAYPRAIECLRPGARVWCRPCPLFVPLAEEGWLDGDVPRQTADRYLADARDQAVDVLVLGCTHYPLLAPVIAAAVGPDVTLIDSARETAVVVEQTLEALDLRCTETLAPQRRFLVSDAPEGLVRIGRRFFGEPIEHVEWVDF